MTRLGKLTPEAFAAWEANRPHVAPTKSQFEPVYRGDSSDFVREYARREAVKDLQAARNAAKLWHDAWYDQRDATGRAAWDNFRQGKVAPAGAYE